LVFIALDAAAVNIYFNRVLNREISYIPSSRIVANNVILFLFRLLRLGYSGRFPVRSGLFAFFGNAHAFLPIT
jgi:hypothetical protein